MEIHVLYDNRPQPDKLPILMAELRRQGIEPTKIWSPIEAKTVIASINRSHKAIVRYAKEIELSEVVLIEDDCQFVAPDGWQYFLNHKPDDYDIYLGGCYGLNKVAFNTVREQVGAIEIHNFVGLHCAIIHSRYYDRFLSVPDNEHIDTIQAGMGKFYLCYPMAAIQRKGFSANNMAEVDYNSQLVAEDVYGGLP